MAKFYQVKKEINGVEYTAQFNGISAALEALDDSYVDGTSNTSGLKLANYVLENVIVDPKVKVDDFDSMEELNAVVKFGSQVMQGKFRQKPDESTADAKGRK